MATTEELLEQILAAQLAQVALLQAVHTMIMQALPTHDRRDLDWERAQAAIDTAQQFLQPPPPKPVSAKDDPPAESLLPKVSDVDGV